MSPIYIVVVIIVPVFLVALELAYKEGRRRAVSRKEERIARVKDILTERGEISNAELREALGVSRRTVVRYMDKLEKEGVVEQVGDVGIGVPYRLK